MLLLIQAKAPQAAAPLPVSNLYRPVPLSFFKAQAVRALIHRRVRLMRTYQDLIQRAVIFVITVMRALLHRTLDTLVHFTAAHFPPPP